MDDEISGGTWSLDPGTRLALRMDAVRKAAAAERYEEVVLEAEELLDEEPDHAEALALLGDALLALGEPELASLALAQCIAQDGAAAWTFTAFAVARFELCDLPAAAEAAREAIRLDADDAEAWFTLGLVLSFQDEPADSQTALTHAHALDPELCPAPLALSQPQAEALIATALASMPGSLAVVWHGVPLHVQARPALSALRQGPMPLPPTVLAMYTGEPPDPENAELQPTQPDGLWVFTEALARHPSIEAAGLALTETLLHEAMSWLGLPPDAFDAP